MNNQTLDSYVHNTTTRVWLAPSIGGFTRIYVACLVAVWLGAGATGEVRGSVVK